MKRTRRKCHNKLWRTYGEKDEIVFIDEEDAVISYEELINRKEKYIILLKKIMIQTLLMNLKILEKILNKVFATTYYL